MYKVAVRRNFIAQHYLVGGDWGSENELHAHHYLIEFQLEGAELDQHGYLVDIVDIEANLERLVAEYRDQVLNDMPAFKGLNPSIEHFARIFCLALDERLQASNVSTITVVLWENDIAWASYRQKRA